ncbi:MAG TPA: hypothetical protein VGD60_19010 [Candidatus Acidoferrales bacterium]
MLGGLLALANSAGLAAGENSLGFELVLTLQLEIHTIVDVSGDDPEIAVLVGKNVPAIGEHDGVAVVHVGDLLPQHGILLVQIRDLFVEPEVQKRDKRAAIRVFGVFVPHFLFDSNDAGGVVRGTGDAAELQVGDLLQILHVVGEDVVFLEGDEERVFDLNAAGLGILIHAFVVGDAGARDVADKFYDSDGRGVAWFGGGEESVDLIGEVGTAFVAESELGHLDHVGETFALGGGVVAVELLEGDSVEQCGKRQRHGEGDRENGA